MFVLIIFPTRDLIVRMNRRVTKAFFLFYASEDQVLDPLSPLNVDTLRLRSKVRRKKNDERIRQK